VTLWITQTEKTKIEKQKKWLASLALMNQNQKQPFGWSERSWHSENHSDRPQKSKDGLAIKRFSQSSCKALYATIFPDTQTDDSLAERFSAAMSERLISSQFNDSHPFGYPAPDLAWMQPFPCSFVAHPAVSIVVACGLVRIGRRGQLSCCARFLCANTRWCVDSLTSTVTRFFVTDFLVDTNSWMSIKRSLLHWWCWLTLSRFNHWPPR